MDKNGNDKKRVTGLRIKEESEGLNTFLGVFTPTILTILGVIMYLRFGWVVGQVGISQTLLIVILANLITLATSLSLSAIATNLRVGVGGAYYMISRSLGLELGGAIGLPLYLSQTLSITLYAYGLAESIRIVVPNIPLAPTASAIIIGVALLALGGASRALKAQLPVMALIAISLIALFGGAALHDRVVLPVTAVPDESVGFWLVFAVFFPAVTGVMSGLGMSGDLQDPRRSIPRGTIIATLTGCAIYLAVPFILLAGADRTALLADPMIWTKIAVLGPWLVLPGLWGAIFSSATGSALAAPRTLQALSFDRLAPRIFSRRREGKKEPLAGMIFTVGLSLAAVLLGDLNTVATVVTMFFLSVYGVLNLVAALERLSRNPSWRPRVNIHWGLSLLGAMGCFGAMLLIHWPSTVIAVATEVILWLWLKRRIRNTTWGDLRRDLYEALIRWALLRLDSFPMSPRNWRPHLLVFVRDVEPRIDLVRFASWFNEERGIVTVCELIPGDLLDVDIEINARKEKIHAILRREGISAFGEVNIAWNIEWGILNHIQAHGMGGLESNTILIGFPDELKRLTFLIRVTPHLKRINRSLIIGKTEQLRPLREGEPRTIHVWWGGLKRNSDLMLMLAYLLTCNAEWRHARIHILSLASNKMMKRQTEEVLEQLIPEIRINAEAEVTVRSGEEPVHDIIRRRSFDADAVFLGLGEPEPGQEEEYARRIKDLVDCMPTCFFVHNGSLFIGDLITPDETMAVKENVEEEEASKKAEHTNPEESVSPTA